MAAQGFLYFFYPFEDTACIDYSVPGPLTGSAEAPGPDIRMGLLIHSPGPFLHI